MKFMFWNFHTHECTPDTYDEVFFVNTVFQLQIYPD